MNDTITEKSTPGEPHVAVADAPTLLVIEDDQAMQQMCIQLFERSGYRAEGVSTAAEALTRISDMRNPATISLVLSDVRLGRDPAQNGIELLREIKAIQPALPVLLMTGYATVNDAVQAMKLGAIDYITKPFERAELLNKVEAQLALSVSGKIAHSTGSGQAPCPEVELAREELSGPHWIKGLIGTSSGLRRVCERIEAAGNSQATVLITGESGTGKELVARAIHSKSARREKPFIPVNCAALPENLIESELFGHEPGAFTGASKEGLGLFRAAHTGTIFLDEVADMPKDVQAKLLRVLQDHRVRPVGSTRETPVDVRVIAATNWNVDKARADGVLRDDVYFRLSVVRIDLPPLRERLDDLPLLAQHFLAKHAKPERRMRRISPEALNAMLGYPWPGNIRELESMIESAYALGREESLTLADLPQHILNGRDGTGSTAAFSSPAENNTMPAPVSAQVPASQLTPAPFSLNAMERDALLRAMQVAHGNKSKAAQILGVSRKRLYRMLYDYRVEDVEA